VNRKQLAAKTRGKTMSNKIFCLALIAMLLVLGFPAEGQQPAKISRIGWLAAGSPSGVAPLTDAFRQGLRQLGYVEGKNIVIEFRYAEGKFDRLPDLAAEIVHLKVDVIVVASTPAIQAVKQATATIPIVMVGPGDPVGPGAHCQSRAAGWKSYGVVLPFHRVNRKTA
jgi:putative tryptophan/tyrosine transport system substrate-binding protein